MDCLLFFLRNATLSTHSRDLSFRVLLSIKSSDKFHEIYKIKQTSNKNKDAYLNPLENLSGYYESSSPYDKSLTIYVVLITITN